MGKYCTLCKATKGDNYRSFHRFPAPQYQKEKWCQVLNKEIKKLSVWTFVCSDHFSPDSFVYRSNGQRYLKDDAVPFIGETKWHIKTECMEQELLNATLNEEIKRVNSDIFKEYCVKHEVKSEEYEPDEILTKTEEASLRGDLTDEFEISNEEISRTSQCNDKEEVENGAVIQTIPMSNQVKQEELSGQPEIYSEMIEKCSTGKNDKSLLKMFRSMYPTPSTDSLYMCAECSFKTTLRQVLRRHFLTHRDNECKKHPEKYTNYQTFRCKLCNYVSLQRYHVSRHMLKHKPKDQKHVTIHFCDQCEYSSKYRCDLMKHKMKHEPDGRRYHCSKCSYKAYERVHLKRHVKTAHINNKQYKFECKRCNYKTDCMGHLNRHTRSTHGEDDSGLKSKIKGSRIRATKEKNLIV